MPRFLNIRQSHIYYLYDKASQIYLMDSVVLRRQGSYCKSLKSAFNRSHDWYVISCQSRSYSVAYEDADDRSQCGFQSQSYRELYIDEMSRDLRKFYYGFTALSCLSWFQESGCLGSHLAVSRQHDERASISTTSPVSYPGLPGKYYSSRTTLLLNLSWIRKPSWLSFNRHMQGLTRIMHELYSTYTEVHDSWLIWFVASQSPLLQGKIGFFESQER